ncbi:uncharacterized protein BDV17DRAFT_78541 [Aspergillus undulatus]|uniref:uncharacterized protein n=1 Tax=Aspergillus undulatus TaxID=1810928 RepID=UPI003CCCDCFB
MLLTYIIIAFLLTLLAHANVEKIIFIAPPAASLPGTDLVPDDLLVGLERLTPTNNFLRTKLNASFPNPLDAEDRGTDSWFFLEGLNPGQRYEVRVCWLATQPTAFDLSTYTLDEVLEDTALLSAISLYSSIVSNSEESHGLFSAASDSVLFLQISAAADYFSLDKTLMENVPPVVADVILDPFLGNVFPRSLVPTAGWIVVVSCFAIVIARWIAREFASVANSADKDFKDGKKIR